MAQEENEEEEELLDNLAACLTAVLRTYGDAAITLMDGLMPKLGLLLDASRSTEERRVGICIVDDILEHSAACEYPLSICTRMLLAHSRGLLRITSLFLCLHLATFTSVLQCPFLSFGLEADLTKPGNLWDLLRDTVVYSCWCWKPAGSQKYMGHLVEVLLQGCKDCDANLRQCSVYGLGVLAQHRPEAFQSVAQNAVSLMVDMLAQPDAR